MKKKDTNFLIWGCYLTGIFLLGTVDLRIMMGVLLIRFAQAVEKLFIKDDAQKNTREVKYMSTKKNEIIKELVVIALFLTVVGFAFWYRDLPWWRLPVWLVLLVVYLNRIKIKQQGRGLGGDGYEKQIETS